jgi:small subunit ribosomal protein S20
VPNIKSAIKRVKTSEKRRLQNASQKSALRTAVKAVETAIQNNDSAAASQAYQLAAKKLDKAVTKGLLHKNAAARKKSRLAKKVNALAAKAE